LCGAATNGYKDVSELCLPVEWRELPVDTVSPALFAQPRVCAGAADPSGAVLLRSAEPLRDYPVSVVHSMREHARLAPDHPVVAERAGDGWRTVRYGEAVAAATAIGQGLLERGLGPDRPLLILSGNSVDHLLMTIGGMTAGIPVAPVSVAYSLQSQDHARIRAIAELIRPGAVFAEDGAAFGPALDALPTVPVIETGGGYPGAEPLTDLLSVEPGALVAAAFADLRPDGIAKILFTSGSTGTPKGVLNTHRMLSANQQMIRQAWPFLAWERPVIVDWLPWSHTFGGNHNMNMVFTSGGTLYVDAGRPTPALFGQTVANLADVPPTIYFNVPAGYARLVPALEGDPEFAGRFFSRLRLMFNAAAALPAALRERLAAVARKSTGLDIPVTGSWGATETAPAVTSAHYAFDDARCIGVPLPGAEVKLVPADEGAYEIRVKGPNVTPGYYAREDLTATAFDEQGFYRTGDAVGFADPDNLDAGLAFRGRIAEDFKLATGTFVRVGALRTALLSAIPVLADAVLTGEDRDHVCALAWLNPAEARALLDEDLVAEGEIIVHPALCAHLTQALSDHNDTAGSAAQVHRLLVLSRPASLDDGEITDKGYINQRGVLAHRAALADLLYAEPAPAGVIIATGDGRPPAPF
jgi:feruloyl-CoA synthase